MLPATYITGEFKNSPNFDPGAGVYNMTSFGDGDAFIVKLDNTTIGIKEHENYAYSYYVFPNPNSGSFNILIDNEIKNGEIILFNTIGQKVFEQTVFQGLNTINTSNLAQGLYNYILLQDKQKVGNGKLVFE